VQILLIATLSIGIGLAACFMGYQLFRALLPFLAALYGYNVAAGWFAPEQWFIPLIVGLTVGVIFALLAYFLWSLTVGIGGALLGFGAGVQLALFLGLGNLLAPVLGIIVAVIFGVMFFSARDVLVMASSALGGAGLTMTGLATLLPGLLGWLANDRNLITFILTLVLATVGFGAQYRTMAGRDIYQARRA
jgi:hypothetical protein